MFDKTRPKQQFLHAILSQPPYCTNMPICIVGKTLKFCAGFFSFMFFYYFLLLVLYIFEFMLNKNQGLIVPSSKQYIYIYIYIYMTDYSAVRLVIAYR